MATISFSKAEKSYVQTSLLSTPALRGDGRSLHDFRAIALETGVSPLANGSARLDIGRNAYDGGGGTEILAAVKLEVEDVENGDGIDGGRIVCTVCCSPAAYPHLSAGALDDLQHDMSTILHQTLSHHSLHPKNLGIVAYKKSWLLNLDIIVLSDSGNVYDAIFMAARAALWDTKVPRTRSVEYKARTSGNVAKEGGENGDMDVDEGVGSGFDTRHYLKKTMDFELPDYWDEGEVLDGRDRWPVCVTLNLLPPMHYLDATAQEEASTSIRLLLVFSFVSLSSPDIQAMRLLGGGELSLTLMKDLIKDGEKYARQVFTALNAKLKDEDVRRNRKARDRFAAHR